MKEFSWNATLINFPPDDDIYLFYNWNSQRERKMGYAWLFRMIFLWMRFKN